MNKIIIATKNLGKIREISHILSDLKIKIIPAKNAGINKDIFEDKKTLEENALKKARFVNKITKEWVLSDDSGIFIDALNGKPGVKSFRWAKNNDIEQYTLTKLINVPTSKRKAYFKTAIALFSPQGKSWLFTGKIAGIITNNPAGKKRDKLPYDTIFIPQNYNKTFAQMTLKQKNQISHRAIALKKFKNFIKSKVK